MGSLTRSTPSVPRYAPVVPSPTVQDAVASDGTPSEEKETSQNDENQDAVRRIIRRNRGVGSTILTSFRGVLGENSSMKPQRKNLLGE